MLHLLLLPITIPQLRLQHPPKLLQQHLEADLGDGRVISSLAELVPDKRVLRPGELMEAKDYPGLAKLLANEITTGVGNVGVFDAKDHGDLTSDTGEEVECVVGVRRGSGGGIGAGVGA